MSSNVSTFRIALYGVLLQEGKVLMTETSVPSGSIINFPGGGLELGESPIDAIQREFTEETGLSITVERLLFCSQKFQQNPEYPHEQLMHIYFLVAQSSQNPPTNGNNDDVVAVHWYAQNQLPIARILPVDREFLEHSSFLSLF